MRRFRVSVALAVLMLLQNAAPAAACSVGPDYDPRDHTQLLVLGRARALELGPRMSFGYIEATVVLDVLHVYRGTAPATLRFVDSRSVMPTVDPRTGRHIFGGRGGGCGTLDADPTGQYVLVALARGDDSRLHANLIFGAIYTPRLDYDAYRWLLQRHGIPVPFLVVGPSWEPLAPGPVFAP